MKHNIIIAALLCLLSPAVWSSNQPSIALSTDLQMRGAADYRFLGLRLYSARLFTPKGQQFSWANPVALELKYDRIISRDNLVRVTLSELKRIENAYDDYDTLAPKLKNCFRDVKDGDQFLAIANGADTIEFRYNDTPTCQLTHSDIRKRFLSIWLSDDSRAPKLSQRLLGK